jgi:hypothetical protein
MLYNKHAMLDRFSEEQRRKSIWIGIQRERAQETDKLAVDDESSCRDSDLNH